MKIGQWEFFETENISRTGDNGVEQKYLWRLKLINHKYLGGLYLHWFFDGDKDGYLHDHPFNWRTIVLWGGYKEHLENNQVKHMGTFSSTYRSGEVFHLVELTKKPTITLFWRGPKYKEWYFKVGDTLVHNENYTEYINVPDISECKGECDSGKKFKAFVKIGKGFGEYRDMRYNTTSCTHNGNTITIFYHFLSRCGTIKLSYLGKTIET